MLNNKTISIEGSDGIGKSSQVALLAKALNAKIVKYPYYDSLSGKTILDILEGRCLINADKFTRSLIIQSLMAVNRYETISQISTDCDVVFDRGVISSHIYGAMDGLPEDFITAINALFPKPDITIIMLGEPFRLNHDYYEKRESQKIINKLYSDYAKRLSLPTVNANQPIEKVHADIMEIINEAIRNKQTSYRR